MKNQAALYARYSTDQQRGTSIDDQLRRCIPLQRKSRKHAAYWRPG